MIVFSCQVCNTRLSAEPSQAGTRVRCPFCKAVVLVPATQVKDESSTPPPLPKKVTISSSRLSRIGPGKSYGFSCGYCGSRLEATESIGGQEGQCPTCGNSIIIPILDRFGRLIDPSTQQIIKPDPHPVHAYAAAGDRAPKIIRLSDGAQAIQCPRCADVCPVTANSCNHCGLPFTLEGVVPEHDLSSDGFCIASLALGIIGLPAFCFALPSILAVVFGIIGYYRIRLSGNLVPGKGMAIAGFICGCVGLLLAAWMYVLK